MLKKLIESNLDNFIRVILAIMWIVAIGMEMLNTYEWWTLTGWLLLGLVGFWAVLFIDVE